MSTVANILSIQGERRTGRDVRTQNVLAAQAIANIVKSSLGPVGLDKMLVDDIGDVTITNDGATILKLLEVEHPAAKVRMVQILPDSERKIVTCVIWSQSYDF
jgi:T-complex protein 1 subunit alpha